MVCNNRWIEKMTHKGGCHTLKFNTPLGVKVDLPNFYNFHQIFVTFQHSDILYMTGPNGVGGLMLSLDRTLDH